MLIKSNTERIFHKGIDLFRIFGHKTIRKTMEPYCMLSDRLWQFMNDKSLSVSCPCVEIWPFEKQMNNSEEFPFNDRFICVIFQY